MIRPATATVTPVEDSGARSVNLSRSSAADAVRSNRYGIANPPVDSGIALEDQPEAVEGEPRLVVLDGRRQRGDQLCQAARGDHGALAELILETPAQTLDLRRDAVDRS